MLLWASRFGRQLITRVTTAISNRIRHPDVAAFIRDQIGYVIRVTVVIAAWILALGMSSLWLSDVLLRFPATRAVGLGMRGAMGSWLWDLLGQMAAALPGLGVVLVIILITGALAHVVRLFFDRIQRRHIHLGWLNADTAVPTRRLCTVVLWLFAIAMAYPYLPGANSEAFKGLSVLVGLMVSLGASGLVGQAASGFIVTYLGVLRIGDYVKVGDTEGEVATIGIFTTRVITVFKESVSVPNILILSNQLLNYSRYPGSAGVAVRVKVSLGYNVPWRDVHRVLCTAAGRVEDVRQDPAPYVLQRALSDFYVEYELCAFLTEPVKRIPVLDRLHQEIQDLCAAEGIQILSPHWVDDPSTPALPRPPTSPQP